MSRAKSIWGAAILQSRTKPDTVTNSEKFIGFLGGPFLVLLLNAVLVGYCNVYFTDVLGISGAFLVVFPMVSSLVAVVMNLVMGVLIDRTHTPAGKARPYLLVAAPLLLVSGIALYTLPATTGNDALRMLWIVISYNLYLSVANTIYSMGHSLMVPLSTRDNGKRSQLSVCSNMSMSGAVGAVSIVFPLILAVIGTSKTKWSQVMCLFSAIACAGALLEYYFTRERITEETAVLPQYKEQSIPVRRQLKAILTEKYWWLIVLFYMLWQFSGTMKNGSMTYFCNYIVGTYSDGFTQTLLALIGAVPMVVGMFIAWPLASRLGKRNFVVLGLIIGVLGGAIMWAAPENIVVVSVGLLIKSIGMIPGMSIMTALFSDVLDHMEWKNGFRCDGLSMSIYSACMVALSGVCSGVMNALLTVSGYTAPDAAGSLMAVQKIVGASVVYCQPPEAQSAISACYILFELVCWALAAALLLFLTVEKNLPAEQAEIKARHKRAARPEI